MGIGTVTGGRINVVVVARHQMAPAEWAQWGRALEKASELLWDATEGQLAFGDIYMADDATGEATADLVLYDAGDPSFNSGDFGDVGAAMHLMPYVKSQVLTILHELGHSMWNFGEEYSQPLTSATIDTADPAPDMRTIPTDPNGLTDNQLVDEDASAIIRVAGQWERRTVVGNTDTSVTVDADYSVLPTDADNTTVWFQRPAECAAVPDPNYCIMENSRDAAGELAPDGTWTPAANPVTEFCTVANHDPDNDTQQEDRHDAACWNQLVATSGFETLTVPAGEAAPGPGAAPAPSIFVLDPDPRYAIVLDRSASMGDGTKLPDAQHGAVFWVEACAEVGEKLTVIWYDHDRDTLLNLTDVGALTAVQQQALVDDIDALTPGGATNIRDALLEALTEISTEPTRAATQVAVLLSDGKHNSPLFSSAESAIPVLRENGVQVYALGVGDPDEVDLPTLTAIAEETGGRSYAVGTSRPNEIEIALVEIHNEVRGGLIDSLPVELAEAGPSELDQALEPYLKRDRQRHRKRPALGDLAEAFGIRPDVQGVQVARDDRVTTIPIPVEKGVGRAWFTLIHPDAHDTWLYLVDPDGVAVDVGDAGHLHRRSSAPHEFSIVSDPKPGWWTAVLVRPIAGPAIRCHLVAGAERRDLRTRIQVSASTIVGATVSIQASTFFGMPLTGLRVKATVRRPSGSQFQVPMDDRGADDEETGNYRGAFLADEPGRYRGVVEVIGGGGSAEALGLTRMLHLPEGVDEVDTSTGAPPFRRRIPFQVLVGKRGTILEDDEREKKYIDHKDPCGWTRPTKLRSARRPRRGGGRGKKA